MTGRSGITDKDGWKASVARTDWRKAYNKDGDEKDGLEDEGYKV